MKRWGLYILLCITPLLFGCDEDAQGIEIFLSVNPDKSLVEKMTLKIGDKETKTIKSLDKINEISAISGKMTKINLLAIPEIKEVLYNALMLYAEDASPEILVDFEGKPPKSLPLNVIVAIGEKSLLSAELKISKKRYHFSAKFNDVVSLDLAPVLKNKTVRHYLASDASDDKSNKAVEILLFLYYSDPVRSVYVWNF